MTEERELLVCLPFLLLHLAAAVLLVSPATVAFLLDLISNFSATFFSGRSDFFIGLFSDSCLDVLGGLFEVERSVFSGLWFFSDKDVSFDVSFLAGFSTVTSLLSVFSVPFSTYKTRCYFFIIILSITVFTQNRRIYATGSSGNASC